MSIVNDTPFSFNKQFKCNFDGGELSSDGGLFLLKEFAHRIGFEKVIRDYFRTNDTASFRFHTDEKNLMQRIYQILAGYFNDNDADISMCELYRFDESGREIVFPSFANEVITGEHILEHYVLPQYKGSYGNPVNKLYKAEI